MADVEPFPRVAEGEVALRGEHETTEGETHAIYSNDLNSPS